MANSPCCGPNCVISASFSIFNFLFFIPPPPPTELMERKLLTERGRKLYKIRGKTVDPVFGQIKDVLGFERFMRRGIDACRSEWSLVCAAHNLLKLWRSGKASWI